MLARCLVLQATLSVNFHQSASNRHALLFVLIMLVFYGGIERLNHTHLTSWFSVYTRTNPFNDITVKTDIAAKV